MSPLENATPSSVSSSDNAGLNGIFNRDFAGEIMAHIASSFLIKGVKELIKEYKKIRRKNIEEINEITRDFGDPRLLWEYYVEPKCQTKNPADPVNTEQVTQTQQKTVHETIKEFLKNSSAADKHKHMFILADAGMGKTSLLRTFARSSKPLIILV